MIIIMMAKHRLCYRKTNFCGCNVNNLKRSPPSFGKRLNECKQRPFIFFIYFLCRLFSSTIHWYKMFPLEGAFTTANHKSFKHVQLKS